MHLNERHYRLVADGGDGFIIQRGGNERLIHAILRGLAEVRGIAVSDLDPLYEHVEIDALENIIQRADEQKNTVSVQFEFEGYTIYVLSGDTIRIIDDSRPITIDDEANQL